MKFVIVGLGLVFAFVASASAQTDMKAACEQLAFGAPQTVGAPQNFAKTFAELPDAPSAITAALIAPAERDLPEVCQVDGYVPPGVSFQVRMPTKAWNGKFMMYGCGGPCGQIYREQAEEVLARGYAVAVTDMGHRGIGTIYTFNNIPGMIDFGYRATHVTTVAAKAIIAAFYGKAASRNYYQGCSTGGRQGMVEAQRFPEDFDGLIAGAPVYFQSGDTPLFLRWSAMVNKGADGKPVLDAKKLPMIHKAVLAACDALDGVADGLLQDPRRCTWDPGAILCKKGAKGDACLTEDEAQVVRKIYTGAVNAKGKKLYWGMSRGSEYYWTPAFIGANGQLGTRATALGSAYSFWYEPSPTYSEFDYDRDPPRLGMLEPLFDARNPDLRALKDHGAKLILYHGWDDNEIPPEATVDYYETATRTMGGADKTTDFFRLFMIPGMNHCRRGPGGDAIDWIAALENWVEKGQAPDKMIVGHLKEQQNYLGLPRLRYPVDPARIDRTRPIYPYPALARWTGTGDVNDAASWEQAK